MVALCVGVGQGVESNISYILIPDCSMDLLRLPFLHLSTCPSIYPHPSMHPSYSLTPWNFPFILPLIDKFNYHLSIPLSTNPSIHPPFHPPTIQPSLPPSIHKHLPSISFVPSPMLDSEALETSKTRSSTSQSSQYSGRDSYDGW